MRIRYVAGIACVITVAACNKGDKKKDDSAPAATPSETKAGEVALETDPLATLQLSASLTPAVPASVTATGAGVEPVASGQVAVAALTAGDRKKSQEACYIRQKIREARMDQEKIAMQLCQIEAQKGMKAGKKYKLKFGGGAKLTQGTTTGPGDMTTGPGDMTTGPGDMTTGPGGTTGPGDMTTGGTGGVPGGDTGTMPDMSGGGSGGPGGDMSYSVFLDNSVADKFSVFICLNDKLSQKIVITGHNDKGSKGTYQIKQEMDGMGSIQVEGAFDNGVDSPDHQRSFSQSSGDMEGGPGGGSTSIRTAFALDIVKDGVSKVQAAAEMASSGGDFGGGFREIGAALIGPNLGSALFQRTISADHPAATFPGGDQPVEGDPNVPPLGLTGETYQTSRSFFDSAGQTLKAADAANFAEGGTLHVKDADLPKLPPEDFAVALDGWDCSGTEDFTTDETSEAVKACEEKFKASFSMETCTDAAFVVGVEAPEVPSVLDQRDAGAPVLPPPPAL